MTNEEQETIDRKALTAQILADAGHPKKCTVVYFLSGSANLTECMSGLLRRNLRYRLVFGIIAKNVKIFSMHKSPSTANNTDKLSQIAKP
jgi:hypothetical protein